MEVVFWERRSPSRLRTPEDTARLIEEGQRVARGMSWDVVARDYLLPALARC